MPRSPKYDHHRVRDPHPKIFTLFIYLYNKKKKETFLILFLFIIIILFIIILYFIYIIAGPPGETNCSPLTTIPHLTVRGRL